MIAVGVKRHGRKEDTRVVLTVRVDWFILTALRCLRSPGGADYKGKQSKTTAGNSCLPWVDVISAVSGFEPDFLPDESAEVAGSFCRNPRGEYSTVMCFVRDQDGSVYEELCDVPLCGGLEVVKYLDNLNCAFSGVIRRRKQSTAA